MLGHRGEATEGKGSEQLPRQDTVTGHAGEDTLHTVPGTVPPSRPTGDTEVGEDMEAKTERGRREVRGGGQEGPSRESTARV